MRGLVVAISVIDAFFVLVVIDAVLPIPKGNSIGVFVFMVAEIDDGRVIEDIRIPNIRGSAGRVDVTDHDIGQGLKALRAWASGPKNRIGLQFAGHQFLNLHDVGGVDDDDHFLAFFLGETDGVLLVLAEGQRIPGAVEIGFVEKVSAFAGDTADINDGGIVRDGINQAFVDIALEFNDVGVRAIERATAFAFVIDLAIDLFKLGGA